MGINLATPKVVEAAQIASRMPEPYAVRAMALTPALAIERTGEWLGQS